MIRIRFGPRDCSFQSRMTGAEQLELLLHTAALDLQLPPTLLAQIFRMRTAHTSQILFDILRLQLFIKIL